MITRAVLRNPFRSTVSLVASMISTALVLSAVCMMDCMDYMITYEFERMSHYDFTVSLRDPQGRNGAPEIGSLPTTATTEPQLSVPCDLSNGPYRKRLGVIGLPHDNRLYTPLDESGQPIVVPDAGLVLARKVAEMLEVQPGDRVLLRPLIARRQEVVAPVVGIVDTFMGLSAYADISYLSRLLGEEWSANVILGRSFRGSSRVSFLNKLKERPTVLGIGERTRALTQLDETMRKTMGTMLGIMVLFAGLIAFGSVLNAALVSLSERRREVGTLRVIGYTPLDTTRIFSGESYLLNGIGVALGLVAGVGLLHLLARAYDTELYRFPIVIYPLRQFQTAVIMLVFITFAQLIIYRIIRKMDWLSVMKTKE
jgi:putative ABC transport system permease protein